MPAPVLALQTIGWTLAEWQSHQRKHVQKANDLLQQLLFFLQKQKHSSWLHLAQSKAIQQQILTMQTNIQKYPFFGVPIAVKDNIDVAGQPTTCGCPSFSYTPTKHAKCIQILVDLGFVVMGKTSMDQFATGLMGARCSNPVPNPFDSTRIAGGSSSGSAYVVAVGWVPLSLGTDTAGSGRVPAAFNNIIGLKPHYKWMSMEGVVPACLSLDCLNLFSLTLKDAFDVYSAMCPSFKLNYTKPNSFKLAVPLMVQKEADPLYEKAFQQCLEQWAKLPELNLVPADFTFLHQLSDFLYNGPYLVERWEVIKNHIDKKGIDDIHPLTLKVFADVSKYTSSDVFQAQHSVEALKQKLYAQFKNFHCILVPTTVFPPFLLSEVQENDLELNNKLGLYTNFVNLAGWSALSLPSGFINYQNQKLPFGITLLAFQGNESWLIQIATSWLCHLDLGKRQIGSLDRFTNEYDIIPTPIQDTITINLGVVGAHMKDFPLHHELIEINAQFLSQTFTSPHYKLYFLAKQNKPGLVRVKGIGYPIQLEVYTVSVSQLGNFLAKIPSPLSLGTIELVDGTSCYGFLCEAYACSHDISSFGSWRNYSRLEGSRGPSNRLFSSVLIANRGEIAVRCIKTLRKLNIKSIAVYTEEDRYSMHVKQADEAILIQSYMDIKEILKAAKHAEAILPGYGFLSESPAFAAACEREEKIFIGPTSEQIQGFALKHTARSFADRAQVPRIPGSKNTLESLEEALREANILGYPCLLKSTAGGGGIGLHVCESEEDLKLHFESVTSLARSHFNDGRLFLEKYISKARHVEVQIFGDGNGKVVCLGDRDCSLQRRHQKVVEESPAPNIPMPIRKKIYQTSIALMELVHYRGPGTVEYLYDPDTEEFYFLEVNTRLQVEHPITEMTYDVDLVEWMIQIACGIQPEKWGLDPLRPKGHAIEVRIYAENPVTGFTPSTGTLSEVHWPLELSQKEEVRVDTWVESGTEITMHFDPLIAKLIVKGEDRNSALNKLQTALSQVVLSGLNTNLLFLQSLISSSLFTNVKHLTTSSLNYFDFNSFGVQILDPGTQTTIQDYPGRIGFWDIGVPPSGPMDPYAFQMANVLAGNDDRGTCALECVMKGPTMKFQQASVIAVTGPLDHVFISGTQHATWTPIRVKAGDVLKVGQVKETGCRIYIAVHGGFKSPKVMNSASTFMLGKMGGHAGGRPLAKGDWLELNSYTSLALDHISLEPLHSSLLPTYSTHYKIAVMMGPHSAPEFLTPKGIETFLSTHWTVDYNSNRLGIRFNGPKPLFARRDGGEAGLHPSNIHDVPYAIGSVNLSGDVPALLTVDGPSLGGFVCPITVCKAEFWKVGQLCPGHTVEFQLVSYKQAYMLQEAQQKVISQPSALRFTHETLFYEGRKSDSMPEWSLFPSVLAQGRTNDEFKVPFTIRQAGTEAILIEFGSIDANFDMYYRFYVHAFFQQLESYKSHEPGIGILVPGVKSAQVQFHAPMNQTKLLKLCTTVLNSLKLPTSIPSRIVYLPFYFDDEASQLAIERYMQTVKNDAPWLPSNIEFLRRANGLESHVEVKTRILDATFLVLGLGDVYLGSPCAVPLNPKHRLLGTKYSPARTYTPEGAVGIGGMYMCIYGMEGSPGGYQLVGRTIPIWKRQAQRPWLRCFDQIRFFLVEDKKEFEHCRRATANDVYQPYIISSSFSLAEHQSLLNQVDVSAKDQLQRQTEAFELEVESWKSLFNENEKEEKTMKSNMLKAVNAWNATEFIQLNPEMHLVKSYIASRVWKILVQPSQKVKAGETLIIVEAMKAEVAISASVSGTVAHLLCKEGELLQTDQAVLILETKSDRDKAKVDSSNKDEVKKENTLH